MIEASIYSLCVHRGPYQPASIHARRQAVLILNTHESTKGFAIVYCSKPCLCEFTTSPQLKTVPVEADVIVGLKGIGVDAAEPHAESLVGNNDRAAIAATRCICSDECPGQETTIEDTNGVRCPRQVFNAWNTIYQWIHGGVQVTIHKIELI